jgi:hypothetical protein
VSETGAVLAPGALFGLEVDLLVVNELLVTGVVDARKMSGDMGAAVIGNYEAKPMHELNVHNAGRHVALSPCTDHAGKLVEDLGGRPATAHGQHAT